MTLEFRDPEPTNRGIGNSSWVRMMEPLMDHAGRWAVIRRVDSAAQAHQSASRLRHGRLKRPPGHWSFAGRPDGNGGGEVFARYDGPEGDE